MSTDTDGDAELRAIEAILTAVAQLDSQARARVVDYVFRRLGLATYESPLTFGEAASFSRTDSPEGAGTLPPPEARDIRSLKETKEPKSATEMAAVVAYYLAELAPPSERKETVSTADLQRYFKQARYPLPQALRVTLAKAASAGYFDAVARGQYKLNPVGYNLVAHGLPERSASGTVRSRRSSASKSSTRQSQSSKASKKKPGRKSR